MIVFGIFEQLYGTEEFKKIEKSEVSYTRLASQASHIEEKKEYLEGKMKQSLSLREIIYVE
jgi:hypothetical protein